MKKRVFLGMNDSVYRVVINTEDWSQGDLELMAQFGEPEINVGGQVSFICGGGSVEKAVCAEDIQTKEFGDEYVRVLHGFPYMRGFDSRDYGSPECAVSAGNAWKDMVLGRLDDAVAELRSKRAPLPTEEVYEV